MPDALRRSAARHGEASGPLRGARVPLPGGRDPGRGGAGRAVFAPADRRGGVRLRRSGPFGVAVLSREGDALLAIGEGSASRSPRARPRCSPRAGRPSRRRAACSRWPTPSLSIGCSRRPASRVGRGRLRRRPRAVRSLARRRQLGAASLCSSSDSAGRSPPTRRPASSTELCPGSTAIEAADRWLAERAAGAAALAGPLREELAARPALEKVYREIERPLTPVLARMELYGVAIDAPFLNEMSARMEKDLRALETDDLAGGRRGVQRQLAHAARPRSSSRSSATRS